MLLLGLTATGLILLRFEVEQMPKRKRKSGKQPLQQLTINAQECSNIVIVIIYLWVLIVINRCCDCMFNDFTFLLLLLLSHL